MQKLIYFFLCLFFSANLAWSYDFMDKGFAFEIISENEKLCSLVSTCEQAPYANLDEIEFTPYSGDLIIPQYATFNGEQYQVYQIGEYAFWQCDGITSLTIPPTLKAIKNNAFYDILTKYDEIGNQQTAKMTKLIIEDSPESLSLGYRSSGSGSSHALFYPYTIDEIYLGRNVSYYLKSDSGYYGPFSGINAKRIFMSDFVTDIPGYLFSYQGKAINELRFSPNATTIGASAFNQSLALTSLEIPEGITTIGTNAFYGCHTLTEVSLPSTLTKIASYGFSACSNLSVVYCYAVTPPSASGAAYSYDVANARLRVPASSVDLYKASALWSNFGEILPLDGNSNPFPTTYNVNIHFPEGGSVRHYVSNGQSFSFSLHPSEGWHLYSVQSNGSELKDNINGDGLLTVGPIKSNTDIYVIFSKDTESGIVNTYSESTCKINIHSHDILLQGEFRQASLYSIDGQLVLSTCEETLLVPSSGVWILKVDDRTFKFLITE